MRSRRAAPHRIVPVERQAPLGRSPRRDRAQRPAGGGLRDPVAVLVDLDRAARRHRSRPCAGSSRAGTGRRPRSSPRRGPSSSPPFHCSIDDATKSPCICRRSIHPSRRDAEVVAEHHPRLRTHGAANRSDRLPQVELDLRCSRDSRVARAGGALAPSSAWRHSNRGRRGECERVALATGSAARGGCSSVNSSGAQAALRCKVR